MFQEADVKVKQNKVSKASGVGNVTDVKEEFFREIQQKQKKLKKEEVGEMLERYMCKWSAAKEEKKQEVWEHFVYINNVVIIVEVEM